MRKVSSIILTLLILFSASQVMASAYGVSGVGLRALSMAGAFRAVANDWSAAYYNPAGLTNVQENQISIGADFYNNRPEFAPDMTIDGYSFGYFDDARVPNDQIAYTPFISGVTMLPLFQEISVGLAIFQPFDYISEWNLYRISPAYNERINDTTYYPVEEPDVPFPDWSHRTNLDVIDIHPTIAIELIEDKASVGVGFSIRKGTYLSDQLLHIPNTLEETFSSRPYDYLLQLSEFDVSGWGFGLNLGFLYNFSERLTFGASYQTKTTIDMDGEAITKFYAPGNRHISEHADSGTVEKEMFEGEIYTAIHDVETEWTLPSEVGFGIAYKLSDQVTAAADFTYTMWSEYEDIELDVISTTGTTEFEFINSLLMPSPVVSRWDDAFRVSVGIEGKVNDRFTLRGGYSYDQSPIPEENAKVNFNNPGDKHHLAGGLSVFHNIFEFSGAVELQITPESEVTELKDLNSDGIWDNMSGTHSGLSVVTSLGATIRF